MSSEQLEDYEEELKALIEEIQDCLTYNMPRKEGEDRRRSLQTLDSKLRQAENLLRDITSESSKAPKSYQLQFSSRLSGYKRTLSSLRKQVRSGSMREELFLRTTDENPLAGSTMGSYEDQLLKNTDTLQRASDSLFRAQQVSAQTDQMAVGVLEDLDNQKESLLRTQKRVRGIDSEMDRTRSLLRTIVCKAIEHRLILVGVIVLELLVLIVVIYWKFFLSKKGNDKQ